MEKDELECHLQGDFKNAGGVVFYQCDNCLTRTSYDNRDTLRFGTYKTANSKERPWFGTWCPSCWKRAEANEENSCNLFTWEDLSKLLKKKS
tara:strand:- start:52 stop:327 length:276 start_codon:yes stop_codon:yes gene_type:complete